MFLNRLRLHSYRFRGEWLYSTIFGVAFGVFISLLYPGEEGTSEFFNIISDGSYAALFGDIDVSAPGWLLWSSFILGLITYYLIAVSGINIGARIVPTTEEDASEVLLGYNSMTSRQFYAENYISAIFVQLAILIPIYIIMSIFTVFVYDAADAFFRLMQTMILTLIIGIFFLSLTSMFTILGYSKKIGRLVGFGYLFYAFIIEILADTPEYADYGDISVNYYVSPTTALFRDYDWQPSFVVLLISLVFLAIGIYRVKYPDYIEKATLFNIGNISNPLAMVSGIISPRSRLATRYPLFAEQFRLDIRAIIVVLGFIIFQQSAVFLTLPDPSQLVSALDASQNPALSAFSQNHETPESFLGFVVLKFYTTMWLFYGIVVAVIASSIATRDVRTNTHDFIFANDIPPSKLIMQRISSLILSFTIIVWGSFVFLRILQSGRVDLAFTTQLGLYMVLWIHYLGLGILLVGISMIPLVSKGRNTSMSLFIFFVVFSFIPFMNESIEFLKYISYISYFDPVGMVYGIVDFWPSFVISSIMFLLSCIFTWYMTTNKFTITDLR